MPPACADATATSITQAKSAGPTPCRSPRTPDRFPGAPRENDCTSSSGVDRLGSLVTVVRYRSFLPPPLERPLDPLQCATQRFTGPPRPSPKSGALPGFASMSTVMEFDFLMHNLIVLSIMTCWILKKNTGLPEKQMEQLMSLLNLYILWMEIRRR